MNTGVFVILGKPEVMPLRSDQNILEGMNAPWRVERVRAGYITRVAASDREFSPSTPSGADRRINYSPDYYVIRISLFQGIYIVEYHV